MDSTSLGIPIPNAPAQIGSALLPQIALMVAVIDALIAGPRPLVLDADATAITSNVLAPVPGLSKAVLSGVVYNFKIRLFVADSNGEGLKINLNGGTAGMTSFRATYKGFDDTLSLVKQSTTLATSLQSDSFSGVIEIEGAFEPSGDGTFAPNVAQKAHSVGSLTVLNGSLLLVEET